MSALQHSPEALRASGGHHYRVHGLKVRSDLPLPELRADDNRGEADVDIRVGCVPTSGQVRDGLSLHAEGVVFRIRDIASYGIRDGREIIVEKHRDASDQNVRLYLLGSVIGVLLHQRGLLPLHANAIEIDGRAVAFMGESGSGKSTLAALLHDAGYRVVADDVCVVRFDEESGWVRVHPGPPRIRLWKDALKRTGREPAEYEFSYAGDETYEKFDVPVSPERTASSDLDLAAVYTLADAECFRISRLSGVDAVESVFTHTYRGFVVSRLGLNRLHFDSAVRVVQSVPIFRLERRRTDGYPGVDLSRIIEHARALIGR